MKSRRSAFCILMMAQVLGLTCLASRCLAAGEKKPSEQQLRFFETRIRPLLAQHCYECHGPEKQEAQLRLDTYAGIIRGGDSGVVVVPGEAESSLLVVAVGYRNEDLQMPPDQKLTRQQVLDLREWVRQGLPYPQALAAAPPPRRSHWNLEEAREHWAFQAPGKPPLPAVRDALWPQTPIDLFVLARLEAEQLSPAPPADRRTLLRRATFDLLGLPPTPEEMRVFLQDDAPDAFARAVDRLLSSPRYGERWGRHWLDVARYADSNGLDENIAHGNAWRYRDYVIGSFNEDRPYDQFISEQIAGDLMPSSSNEELARQRLVATGFLSLGPKVLAEGDEQKMEMDIVDEQLDTLGRSLMGLTLGCARCHDHKFDPIRTEDYYAMAGIFRNTRTMESLKRIARWNENSIASLQQRAALQAHQEKVAEIKRLIEQLAKEAEGERTSAKTEAPDQRSEDSKPQSAPPSKPRLPELREELARLEKSPPPAPTAMGVNEGPMREIRVHIRGSHLTLGKAVARGVPEVLAFDGPLAIDASRSGRRELAQWLTDPRHPLTSRVIVNRLWRWHFGQGLVASTENFGRLGQPPANDRLLDWLAVTLVENGWSIKSMHRLILLSSVYQMSSQAEPPAAARDPENRLQGRASLQRLEAEAIRDSLLAVSGLLDETMGGSLLAVENRQFIFDHTSKDETSYDSRRRSVYLPVIRNHLYDVFSLFDYSDASVSQGDRGTSTIAPQALFAMNSSLMLQASEALAVRLQADIPEQGQRIRRLYHLAYGRDPSGDEVRRAVMFLDQLQQDVQTRPQAWAAFCQVILASNEFLYVR